MSWLVVFGTSPFSGTCQLSLLERLESSHSAVWSSVPGPGDESLTGHPPPSSLALSAGHSNLPTALDADVGETLTWSFGEKAAC